VDTPFENYILPEVVKSFYNQRIAPPVFFWRDQAGHEIDLIIEESGALLPVEIKSGSTAAGDMFKGLGGGNILQAGQRTRQRSSMAEWKRTFATG